MDSAVAKIIFSAKEKALLASLLKNEKIIEDKRTNKSTNKLKADAWERVTRKYNSHIFVNQRSTIQLRRCWEKIKRFRRMANDGNKIPNLEYVSVNKVSEETNLSCNGDADSYFNMETESNIDKQSAAFEVSAISRASPTESTSSPVPPASVADMNCNLSVHRCLATSNINSMKRKNILRKREQQHNLYLLRQSFLQTKNEEADEKLRHLQKVNEIKEMLETEKLEHQRELWKLEIEQALRKE